VVVVESDVEGRVVEVDGGEDDVGDCCVFFDQGQHADVFLVFAVEVCLLVYDDSGNKSVWVVAGACRAKRESDERKEG